MNRKIVLISLLLSGCILTACTHTKSQSNQEEKQIEQVSSKSKSTEFAEYLSKNETIIYDLENSKSTSKETRIQFLLVAKNDTITAYDLRGSKNSKYLTLGDVSKLSDKEVIEKAKELHKQNIKTYYDNLVNYYKEDLELTQKELDEYKAKLDKYPEGAVGIANGSAEEHEQRIERHKKTIQALENSNELTEFSKPSTGSYSINLKTDGSGNQTAYESLKYTGTIFDKKNKKIDFSYPLKNYFPTTEDNGFGVSLFYATDIYDSTFNIGVNKDHENTIAIRTNKNTLYTLDNPKTNLKNITVDKK